MKRSISVAALALLAAVSLAAQAPKGWKVRADGSTNASDPDAPGEVQFVTAGNGFHATNPEAAIYWNPSNTAGGGYSVKGTFTLLKTTGHAEYYGLLFGGSDLEGPKASYLYFMVARTGTWLIKRWNPDGSTDNVSQKTASSAVKTPDSTGKSTNVLEVRVMPDKIEYVINGTVVSTTPKKGPTAKTDGIAGIRINHMLEVQIDGFAVSKL